MTDPIMEFRKSRCEALGALVDECAAESRDIESEVDNIVGRLRELYLFAPDLISMADLLKDIATRNNLLYWAKHQNDPRPLDELPWGRIAHVAEHLAEQPRLHQRDWSAGPIQLQFSDAVTGWIDIEEWAQRAKSESQRRAQIDDISILTGAYNVFEHMSTGMLKGLDAEAGEKFEDIATIIVDRPDAHLDMLPASLTYFGDHGVMVLNFWPTQQADFIAKLQEFATEGLFDADRSPQLAAVADAPARTPYPAEPAVAHRGGPSAVGLAKGGNVSLTQQAPGLVSVAVGLGWDARTTSGAEFDLDASAFACGADRRVLSEAHFVFYNNPRSPEGALVHTGDNRTGAGDGDDEVIEVDLGATPVDITNIFFAVSIDNADSQGLTFGQVRNAFIRVVDRDTGDELARFDLTDDAATETAMIFGELYRRQAEWKFRAIGQGYASGLAGIARDYGVDAS